MDYKKNLTLTPQAEARLRQSMQDIKNGDYTVAHGVDGLAKTLKLHHLNSHSEIFG